MSTPALSEMLAIWQKVTQETENYLDNMTNETLQNELLRDGQAVGQSIGSALHRVTYHYWFHIGEIQAIRQMLGHTNLPEYVGDLEIDAPYRSEL